MKDGFVVSRFRRVWAILVVALGVVLAGGQILMSGYHASPTGVHVSSMTSEHAPHVPDAYQLGMRASRNAVATAGTAYVINRSVASGGASNHARVSGMVEPS